MQSHALTIARAAEILNGMKWLRVCKPATPFDVSGCGSHRSRKPLVSDFAMVAGRDVAR